MANILLIFVCLFAGIVMKRTGRFPAGSTTVLNQFVINISLPAMALYYVHKLHFSISLLYPLFMGTVVFAGAAAFFILMGRVLKLERKTIGCLILCGGFGNTSFVGFPMIQAYYGESMLGYGVLCDQGTFVILSTLGIFVAAKYSSGSVTRRDILNKIVSFPPFMALALALLLKPFPFPIWFDDMLKMIAATVTPLALVSVGLQFRLGDIKTAYGKLSLGMAYKLILAPLAIFVLFVLILGGRGDALKITLFESAMAPMITSCIIAADNDLDPSLATLMAGIGIPVSFITLTALYYMSGWI